MLRVVEEAARTDTGRQRTANEDAYLARAPVYAVADGMGGAQAGEVAARIAAEAFEGRLADDANPERELARIASEANRRIFQLAREDASRTGMGTTLTGALLTENEVSIVHVGDSRAYLLRNGELRQLTRDHSLVEELRRRGQLTDDEAEDHPQRSIITRALGPEADVELDLHTHQLRSDDVLLLCSDGLTSMVREERLHEILTSSDSLQQAVDQLVDEANRMGGRDNITAILFRVGDGESPQPSEQASQEAGQQDTAEQTATDLSPVPAAPPAEPRREKKHKAAPPADPAADSVGRRRRRRRRLRIALATGVVLLVLGGLTVGAAAAVRSVYFIGQDDRGLVTLYRGVPYDLPAGIKLYDTEYVSSVQARSLRPFERRRLLDHELRSRSDAASRIRNLERGE